MLEEHDVPVSGNELSAPEKLLALITASDIHTRRRIAESPQTPAAVLDVLAADADDETRIAVGANAATPRYILDRLVADESISVRYELAEDPLLPIDLLFLLSRDDNPYVRQRANKTIEIAALERALKHSGFAHEDGDTDRLGELLAESGVFTKKQVDEFLRQSSEQGLPLGSVIAQAKALPRSFLVLSLHVQTLIRRGEISHREAVIQLKMTAGNL